MKNGLITYANGTNRWYLNDQLHGEDGPAVEYTSGSKWWYLNGLEYTLDGYMKELKMTKQDQVMFKLKYGGDWS
jgi:hypothetical protein